jgi:hypothetical protein
VHALTPTLHRLFFTTGHDDGSLPGHTCKAPLELGWPAHAYFLVCGGRGSYLNLYATN